MAIFTLKQAYEMGTETDDALFPRDNPTGNKLIIKYLCNTLIFSCILHW